MRTSSKQKASSARVVTTTTAPQSDQATKKPTTNWSPFLINPQDGDFHQYKNTNNNNILNNQLSKSSSANFAVTAPQPPSASRANNTNTRTITFQTGNRRNSATNNNNHADELSDSDDDMMALAQNNNNNNNNATRSMSSSNANQNNTNNNNNNNRHQLPNNNNNNNQHQQRQLSKFEQKRMQEASQRQKDNIIQPQTVRGVEFSGSAFRPSISEIRFDDFTMDIDNSTGKPKTYSVSVTFTNVSLAAASMRPDAIPREHADSLVVKFVPCGMVSPGMNCSAQIIFSPKEMQDITTKISFTTSTGKLFVPVLCRIPRLGVSVSTRRIDFDVVSLGTIAEKQITIRNSGSLSTAFMLQGELIDDLKLLKHPTIPEMIAEKRGAIRQKTQQAETLRLKQIEESNQKRRETLDLDRNIQPILSAEEIAQAEEQQQQLIQLQQQQLAEAQQAQQSTVRSNRAGPVTSARDATTNNNNKARKSVVTETPRKGTENNNNNNTTGETTKVDNNDNGVVDGDDANVAESAQKKETHPVFTLIETDTCDSGIIDDILHGETVALRANSAVTICIRFNPHKMMRLKNEETDNQQEVASGNFETSFFVAFEAGDLDDVPVLVSAKTKDLPVVIEKPTEVVDLQCGYYGIQYRSEITLRNNKNVSVRVSPRVPASWKDHVIFTPTTAVIQPQEPFTFRIKLVVPESTPLVLFHIMFDLADENLPLILFVSGKFCSSDLIISPQDFSLGVMNENEFYSQKISIKNPGLLPRCVCVTDFPANVTVNPRTAVSLAAQKKRAKQLDIMANPAFNNNKCNMIILPGETFEFDVAVHPPDALAPGLSPAQEWTDIVTLRADDDTKIPLNISGSRRRPPLEFSTPFVLLPRCAVWDVVSVAVVLKNKTNAAKSFSFANIHPKLGIRVAPVSGEIEKNSSVVIVVEFHAHGNIVETLPLVEADLRPSEAEMNLAASFINNGNNNAGSPLADTKRSGVSAASAKKDKNKGKEEFDQLARDLAGFDDAKKRVVQYCEFVCNATREELKQVQPWEQAPNDAQRVTCQLVQPGEPAVDLLLSSLEQHQLLASKPGSSATSSLSTVLPLPTGSASTTSLFNQLFFSAFHTADEKIPLLTRTVVVPCHIQGWNGGWIGLSVRTTVIAPTILAESHTTKELMDMRKQQQVRDLQRQRQQFLLDEQTAANNNNLLLQNDSKTKPRTPRGGGSESLINNNNSVLPSLLAENQKAKAFHQDPSLIKKITSTKKFEDSHVFVLFPPTASITGKSTNSIKLSFASILSDGPNSLPSQQISGTTTGDSPSNNFESSINGNNNNNAANINNLTTSAPPKNKKIFVSVTPLDPHGPFQLLVPPKTELQWPDLASTECTFAFRPKYSALYRVESSIIISSPQSGIIHQIKLRFEGQGLPTSFAVSTDKNSLQSELVTAADAAGYLLPPEVVAQHMLSLNAAGGGGGGVKTSGRPTSSGRGGVNATPSSPLASNSKNNSNYKDADANAGNLSSSSTSMPVNSVRDVPALRLSLGNCIVGSSRAQETVYVLNRSTFPITCKFDVASHRSCPPVDNGGILPFAVEPTAVHLAPFSIGEAVVSCSSHTSGTFLSAIRVTTSEDKITASSSSASSGDKNDDDDGDESKSGDDIKKKSSPNNNNNNDEDDQKIESESELLVSCNIWDYPVFALLPATNDTPIPASKISSLISSNSQNQTSNNNNSKSGANNNSAASSSKANAKDDQDAQLLQQQQEQSLPPVWLLPPTSESTLKKLSVAAPLELSVVSRKNKSLTRARAEAFQALQFATAGSSNPLMSSGGAIPRPLISAGLMTGSSSPSAISSLVNSNGNNNNNGNNLQLIGSYSAYGRETFFGQSIQPGSCAEYPLVLNFVTKMFEGSGGDNNSIQTSTIVSSVLAAEKTALTTTAGSNNNTHNNMNPEKSPTRKGDAGSKSPAAAALLAQGFNAAGAHAQMMQPVAAGVAHQIVIGFVKTQGASLMGATATNLLAGNNNNTNSSSSGEGGNSNTANTNSRNNNNNNANSAGGVATGEFFVDSAILDPVAQRQGWRVDPPRGVITNANSATSLQQRVLFSFTPTAALVNALPVPGVTVSSSLDVKLSLKYSNAEPQVVYLKLVGQVRRE